MKRLAAIPLFIPLILGATTLEEKPWFGNMCEFNWRAEYGYSFYDKVDRARVQLQKTSHDHLAATGLGVTIPDDWNWQVEVDFFSSPRTSFNWRSFAISARKRFLDDLCYDPISLTAGVTMRAVSRRMLEDVSVPFHSRGDFELHTALGKEWSQGPYWQWRIWGLGAVGIGIKGLPWFRTGLYFMGNWCDRLKWRLFGRGYFGTGRREHVSIQNFNGWGNLHHQSIDLGASIKVLFGTWGTLRFGYMRRVFAHVFPEDVNFFTVTYKLPFCPI